ncbi:MAG: YqeG family HAD IIIA-type phosphatase [Dethiobacteria bacterium]|nr:YqeG family HAD IIIA-type phosphatase [Alcaligenaceae bacterium]NLC51143.1 YqeG family HAD IIIA-type phosphatase [Bacillota bacterium]
MLKLLCPDLFLDNIYALDHKYLKERGIKGIITDLDNTLVPWNERSFYPRLGSWLRELQREGLKVCIVSNNSHQRGAEMADALGVPAVWKAVKPRRIAFRRALKMLNLAPEEVAVIGDQIFTDILGGNRLSLYTILVTPINKREFIGTRIMRCLERLVISQLKKRGLFP